MPFAPEWLRRRGQASPAAPGFAPITPRSGSPKHGQAEGHGLSGLQRRAEAGGSNPWRIGKLASRTKDAPVCRARNEGAEPPTGL